jgi:hypothetical protein
VTRIPVALRVRWVLSAPCVFHLFMDGVRNELENIGNPGLFGDLLLFVSQYTNNCKIIVQFLWFLQFRPLFFIFVR